MAARLGPPTRAGRSACPRCRSRRLVRVVHAARATLYADKLQDGYCTTSSNSCPGCSPPPLVAVSCLRSALPPRECLREARPPHSQQLRKLHLNSFACYPHIMHLHLHMPLAPARAVDR